MSKLTAIKAHNVHTYKIDEAANEYPMLTKEEYKRLLEDIRANGQKQPVVIYKDKIIDGRNRVKAILDLEMDLKALIVDSSYKDALKIASSNNDKRRHMSKSQFAMKAAYRILKSRVDANGNAIKKTEWLEISKVQEVTDKVVSLRNVKSAIRVASKNEVLAKKVFDGHIDLVNAIRDLEDKEISADANVEYFKDNVSASKGYKGYIERGAFSKQELAKKLVELEIEVGAYK